MEDFIGELLDRIDASGQNFSQRAYETLSQDLEPLLRLLFILVVLFYGVQLFLGTSRLSVAEIIGRLVRVFVIMILVGTWSNFNDLVYEWLTEVPEAAGRAILAASGTGVTEPTNGLSPPSPKMGPPSRRALYSKKASAKAHTMGKMLKKAMYSAIGTTADVTNSRFDPSRPFPSCQKLRFFVFVSVAESSILFPVSGNR